jgi:SpoIID/LytB domain protein
MSMALADLDEEGLEESPDSDVEVPIVGDPDELVLHSHRDPTVELAPAVVTGQTETEEFGLVGVTAAEPFDSGTRVIVRVREDGEWTDWAELPISEHLPDPGTDEAEGVRYATEPLVTTGADGVQVRIDTPSGEAPEDTQLAMLDNPVTADDASLGVTSVPLASAQASYPRPTIISRAQWGANESLRRGTPSYSSTLKVAFVHHVVSSNNYTEAQAPQQIRNVYSWFTQVIGVADFGYNFIVDRFGRIYEGRAGGIDRIVNGAHTQGFNAESFAVSYLGDARAENLNPIGGPVNKVVTDTVATAMADLIAWKFSIHHVDPMGTSVLTSAGPGPGRGGTSKYWPGEKVSSPTIAGHGDIGVTDCPGSFLRPYIPELRGMVGQRMGRTFYAPTITGSGSAWGSGTNIVVSPMVNAAATLRMEIRSACGDLVRTVGAQTNRSGRVPLSWDGRDADGNRVPPGRYTVSVGGSSGSQTFFPWTGSVRIATAPGAPADPCTPPDQFTVTGTGYGHGVGLSQWGALGQAREGRSADQILSHYFPGTTLTSMSEPSDVRISLLYQVVSAQVRTEAIAGGSAGLEFTLGTRVIPGVSSATYSFSLSDGFVRVTQNIGADSTVLGRARSIQVRWAGTTDAGSAGSAATLLNVIGPGESFASPNHRYRHGRVEITPVSTSNGQRLAVVNVVGMDEYLRGIAEVPATWPQPALQAQVIASRSYALAKYNAGLRSACQCHMDDGRGPFFDQTYRAWAVENGPSGDRWVQAVRATRDRVVAFNGAPIPAFYTAATGGRTQSSSDVWGGAGYPWSRSVDDRWSLNVEGNPYQSWTVVVSQSRMSQIFGLSDVVAVRLTPFSDSTAIRTMTATSSNGATASIAGTAFRSALGSLVLRSTYITGITGETGSSDQPTNEVNVSLTRTPSGTIPAGSTATLSGTVSPASAGLSVQRQVRWDSRAWENRERISPAANGSFAFSLPNIGPAGTTYFWRALVYRGSTLVGVSPEIQGTIGSATGTPNPTPAPTPAPNVPRNDISVSLQRSPSGALAAGSTAYLRGRVNPMSSSLVVQRQVRSGSAGWANRERVSPGANGRFRFEMANIGPAGASYTWRVVVLDGTRIVATSGERSARITAGSNSSSSTPRSSVSVSLQRSPSGALAAGSTAYLRGRVNPMSSSLVVQRQVRSGSAGWANRERVSPGANGRFRFEMANIGPAGASYTWRVVVLDGTRIVATSGERSARIR